MNFLNSRIDVNDVNLFNSLNATAVGNTAYLSINACNQEIRTICENILINYKSYLTNFQK